MYTAATAATITLLHTLQVLSDVWISVSELLAKAEATECRNMQAGDDSPHIPLVSVLFVAPRFHRCVTHTTIALLLHYRERYRIIASTRQYTTSPWCLAYLQNIATVRLVFR
jgi:hypothetical protein